MGTLPDKYVYVPLTWGEWKAWVAAHGVKDTDPIRYIDCGAPREVAWEEGRGAQESPWYRGWAIT